MRIALLKAGLIKPEDLPRSADRYSANKKDHETKQPMEIPFEKEPEGQIIEKEFKQPHEPDKSVPEDITERYKGQMVWLHKTAPVFEIIGKPTLTTEDMEKGRRR